MVRWSWLALSLALVAPASGWSPPAAAAEPLGPQGVVLAAISPPVVADGRDVDVIFVALNADGTPARALKGEATATAGVVGALSELAPGVWRVPFHAAPQRARDVTVTLKGTSARQPFTASAELQLVPAPPPPQARFEPPTLVVDGQATAALTLTGAGPGALVRASTGELGTRTDQPGGGFTARFSPGAERSPRVALVTFADPADPARFGYVALPLSGRVDFPVKGDPGASVELEVSGRTFGPVVLDAAGRGQVTIEVPPGVSEATSVATVAGARTRKSVDLRIPEARRVALVPPSASVPADPSRPLSLWAVVVRPDGAPDAEAAPTFRVSAGAVGPVRDVGGGVYEASFTPAAEAGPVTVTATLGSEVQTDVVELVTVQPPVSSLDLAVEGSLPASGGAFLARITPRDAAGLARRDVRPGVALENASRSADPTWGDGAWVLRAEGSASGAVRVTAWPVTEPSRNPVAQVVVIPERSAFVDDGAATLAVRVVAVDAFGAPVPRASVAVRALGGGATLSTTGLVVGDDGIGTLTCTAGAEPALVGVVAESGGASGTASILQVPDPDPRLVLPPAGSEAQVAAATAWRRRLVTATVDRSASGRPLPAVEQVTLAVDGVARPGGTVTLTTASVDAGGKPLGGAAPTLRASAGTLTEPVAQPDGTVTSVLAIPDDHRGPIEVVATFAERSARVTLGDDDAGPAWVAQGPPTEPSPWEGAVDPPPAPAEPPVAPPPSPPGRRHPALRLRASVAGGPYRYEQAPSEDPGPLLPSRLTVGGPDGGSPALPLGGEVDARVFGDDLGLPWLGAHGQLRAQAYSITSSAFTGPAHDVLANGELDLMLRYPFEIGADQFWVAAKGGFHDNDFLAFTGCLDPGCEVRFDPVNVTGLGVGAEIGADVARWNLVAGYTLGLAGAVDPYANAIDLDVAFEAVHRVFVDLGFTSISRSVVLEGADTGLPRGTLTDANLIFKLGAGIAL